MNKLNSLFNTSKNRIGFHYYPDTFHYRDSDLQHWLPELVALKASWLVLEAPTDRAIPEHFITSLMKAGIQPIIQFKLSLADRADTAALEPMLAAYARWGIKGVIFYDRPNSRTSWSPSTWVQQGLVDRFLDQFLPLANLAIQNGLNPIFPPLEPGGNYWDTAFLRTALETLEIQKQTLLLQNLVIAAYAWNKHDSLNWGSGGPQRWTDTHPYFTPTNQQDQRSFRIFDWYNAITQAVLQKSCPIILLGSGVAGDPEDSQSRVYNAQQHSALALAITRALAGEQVPDPASPQNTVESIPDYVIAANFWLLTTDAGHPYFNQAWYQNDTGQPTVQAMKNYLGSKQGPALYKQNSTSQRAGIGYQVPNPIPQGVTPTSQGVTPAPQGVTPVSQGATPVPQNNVAAPQPVNPPVAPNRVAPVPPAAQPVMAKSMPRQASPVQQSTSVPQRPIQHYLLLPTYEWGVADWHLEVIQPFIKKYRPTVGFSVKEAALAKRVTVIGNTQTFPESLLDQLRQLGCLVERISGDGTSVATQLAER
ncbi:MAG: hypothetical protein LWX83_15200 [Anaerolineae bacterium]|nr:hypothetical protein [Anaerolineae bacterium]